MNYRKIIAHEIWKIREEVGMKGTPEHDFWLAGEYIEKTKYQVFVKEYLYSWLMEREAGK